jgi:hypothetical protein
LVGATRDICRATLAHVASHRYFVCLEGGAAPIPWDLSDEDDVPRLDCVYFGRALRRMEPRLRSERLTFYLTWDIEALPTYGDDVVALVLGDEDSHRPRYADDVLAVFKCYGARPPIGSNPLRQRTRLSTLILAQDLRRHLRHVGDDLRAGRRVLAGRRLQRVEHIPLGYYNQLDLPLTEFDARSTSVLFAGSLELRERSPLSPRHWLRMPKPVARQQMLEAVRRFEQRRPEASVSVRLTPTFLSTTRADADAYSRELMDAKVCLVPRGASVETFRYFEALRYGCVVVCERLPSTWFYDGSPAVVVDRWNELPAVLERLLADPGALRERHAASLAWWRERCSEDALGAFMAGRLNAATGR